MTDEKTLDVIVSLRDYMNRNLPDEETRKVWNEIYEELNQNDESNKIKTSIEIKFENFKEISKKIEELKKQIPKEY